MKQILSDGREIAYAYDPNGNPKSITPPGRPAHSFEYTPVNLTKDYLPPNTGADSKHTSYAYDKDKQLIKISRPDGKITEMAYDNVGQLVTVTLPGGMLRLAFDAKTQQLKTVTAPDGGTLSFTYDGFLPTNTTWEGTIKGSVSRTYDNNLRLTSQSVNGGPPVVFKHDPNGLLTQAGALTLERDPQNGLLRGTKLGKVTTAIEYNGFGERKRFAAAFNDKEIFAVQYERDPLGRIAKQIESIQGQTDVYNYDYDRAGRLADVAKNGKKVGHYEYDSNGNRLKYEGRLGNFSGSYDAQDRILGYGNVTFKHTSNGEWLSKTEDGKTTSYNYDVLGNLRAVDFPDGTKLEYLIDGASRRIGKKVNGKLVQGFLWQSGLRPIAELDGAGNVVTRFIYGTRINVPEYMEKGGKTYRIIIDHLGSVPLVVDVASGQVTQRMDYDEFGNILQDTSPGFQPFGFGGGIYDQYTRLTRFGKRDYDAVAGRWTAKDPIRFAGGDTNMYAYVRMDPVNSVDPSGLQDDDDPMANLPHDPRERVIAIVELDKKFIRRLRGPVLPAGPIRNTWYKYCNAWSFGIFCDPGVKKPFVCSGLTERAEEVIKANIGTELLPDVKGVREVTGEGWVDSHYYLEVEMDDGSTFTLDWWKGN